MPNLFEHTAPHFRLRLHYTEAKDKLFLDLESLTDATVTEKDVLELVAPRVPGDLLNKGVVRSAVDALKESPKVENRRIAKSELPTVGKAGRLVFLVTKLTETPDIAEDEKGAVSLSDLHLFDNIIPEQPLARVYPPKAGAPGKNVLGEPIDPEEAQAVSIGHDEETVVYLTPEELEKPYGLFRSLAEGYLCEEMGKLTVRNELIIRGDLDYAFGNIDFIGSVTIEGEVRTGFRVKAKGSIVVRGEVGDSFLTTETGNIEIDGFFQGGGEGTAISGGAFRALGVNQAHVQANGEIEIDREALHSRLRSAQVVRVNTGRLVGGEVFAVDGVESPELGSEANTPTHIQLCSSVETTAAFTSLLSQIVEHEQVLSLLDSHLGPYAGAPEKMERLQEPFQSKMKKLFKKRKSVAGSLEVLSKQRDEMLEETLFSQQSQVNVLVSMYPGVTLEAGEAHLEPKDIEDGPCTFLYDREKGEFVRTELQPLPTHEAETEGGEDGSK